MPEIYMTKEQISGQEALRRKEQVANLRGSPSDQPLDSNYFFAQN
jgi:hypothetical protein